MKWSSGPRPVLPRCVVRCAYHSYRNLGSLKIPYALIGNPLPCPASCAPTNNPPSPQGNFRADSMVCLLAHEMAGARGASGVLAHCTDLRPRYSFRPRRVLCAWCRHHHGPAPEWLVRHRRPGDHRNGERVFPSRFALGIRRPPHHTATALLAPPIRSASGTSGRRGPLRTARRRTLPSGQIPSCCSSCGLTSMAPWRRGSARSRRRRRRRLQCRRPPRRLGAPRQRCRLPPPRYPLLSRRS
jgi:hypothetical protein